MYLPGFSVTTTTHNAEGKSVVKTDNPKPRTVVENATQIVYSVPGGSLKDGRVSFADEVDLAAHEANPKAFPAPGGCAVVTIAFLPGTSGPMHRTRSLDAGVVVGGESEYDRLLFCHEEGSGRGGERLWIGLAD